MPNEGRPAGEMQNTQTLHGIDRRDGAKYPASRTLLRKSHGTARISRQHRRCPARRQVPCAVPRLREGLRRRRCSALELHAPVRHGLQSASEIRRCSTREVCSSTASPAHCPLWVHTTAWTASPTVRPFLPSDVADKSPADVEAWAETYLLQLFDLAVELGVKIRVLPMFWGVAFGWEVASGYPWGFWAGQRLRPDQGRAGTVRREDRADSARRPTSAASTSATRSIPAPPRCAPTTSTCS